MANKYPLFFGILLLCASFGAPCFAAEALHYGQSIPRSSLLHIEKYGADNSTVPIHTSDIAKTDLNQDGLPEFIYRSSECAPSQICTFQILAETSNQITSLGTIQSMTLMLGTEYSDGVRNILSFENPANDFDYALYTWHPKDAQYKKARP